MVGDVSGKGLRAAMTVSVIVGALLNRRSNRPAALLEELNRAIMERYRPEMRKYYYDRSRYKTYLEQLGIEYPTVKK